MKTLYRFNSFIEKWMALVTPACLAFGVLFSQIAKHVSAMPSISCRMVVSLGVSILENLVSSYPMTERSFPIKSPISLANS